MDKNSNKDKRRARRHIRIRRRVLGEPGKPRLAVYKSLKHIHAQVIDDLAGRTLVSASSTETAAGVDKSGNCAAAKAVGKLIAERAGQAGVKTVAFDRGGFKYHGRIKALAEGAREAGLKF